MDSTPPPTRHFLVRHTGPAAENSPHTTAIQRAIDDAAAAGGGTVVFEPGVYFTGSLFLKSYVDLRLDAGVELRAVQRDDAFPEIATRVAGIEMHWPAALLNICGQHHVRISGGGTIDGRGEFWWRKYWGEDELGGMLRDYEARGLRWAVDYDCRRPRLLLVQHSEHVELQHLTLKRSGFWTVHVCYSSHVTIEQITIRENLGPSSDGIDIDSSSDILVRDCDIDCNDDAICLKAGRDADGLRVDRPTERVIIRDCTVRTGHGLFTIGSETSGGIRDIEVSRLRALGTWTGINFKSARTRGGRVENISIRDIEMIGVPRPFRFTLNWMPSYSYPTLPAGAAADVPAHWKTLLTPVVPSERGIPEFRGITFEHLTAFPDPSGAHARTLSSSVGMHLADPRASLAFDIEGNVERPLSDFRWCDVRIEADQPGTIRHASRWSFQRVQVVTQHARAPEMIDCRDFNVSGLHPGAQRQSRLAR